MGEERRFVRLLFPFPSLSQRRRRGERRGGGGEGRRGKKKAICNFQLATDGGRSRRRRKRRAESLARSPVPYVRCGSAASSSPCMMSGVLSRHKKEKERKKTEDKQELLKGSFSFLGCPEVCKKEAKRKYLAVLHIPVYV